MINDITRRNRVMTRNEVSGLRALHWAQTTRDLFYAHYQNKPPASILDKFFNVDLLRDVRTELEWHLEMWGEI
jgi:hypothetical protein